MAAHLDSNMHPAQPLATGEPVQLSLEPYEVSVICLDLAE